MHISINDNTTLKLNVDVKNEWHILLSIGVHFEDYRKCDGAVKVSGFHT
jgi:hypothetical protein